MSDDRDLLAHQAIEGSVKYIAVDELASLVADNRNEECNHNQANPPEMLPWLLWLAGGEDGNETNDRAHGSSNGPEPSMSKNRRCCFNRIFVGNRIPSRIAFLGSIEPTEDR